MCPVRPEHTSSYDGFGVYPPAYPTAVVEATKAAFGERLLDAGYGPITTEIAELDEFYYAEDYHQQYLSKVPNGYCGLGSTGMSCPVGVARTPD